jgi:type IV pilus assembly protein PilB
VFIDAAQITDIVTMIMAAAIKSNSSDVHIEAEENSIKVRFRVDGVLHDAATIDKELRKN